jgi:hypothetical protein
MKKHVIINKGKLTREANLYPSSTVHVNIANSATANKDRSIEKHNNYLRITFKERK